MGMERAHYRRWPTNGKSAAWAHQGPCAAPLLHGGARSRRRLAAARASTSAAPAVALNGAKADATPCTFATSPGHPAVGWSAIFSIRWPVRWGAS